MLILPIEEAEEGMTLAAPVLNPAVPDQELLRRGFVLEATIIRKMRDLEIPFIYVEYPPLDHLDKHLTAYLSPARQSILKQIKQSFTTSQSRTRTSLPYSDYTSSMRDMISTLMEQGQHPIYLDQMSRMGADTVAHAAAVAHLSLLLGMKLENYLIEQRKRLPASRAKDIVNLGVAGMLHDLGMMDLPENLRVYCDADRPPGDADFREWKTHAERGYDKIRSEVEATAASAVLHHHQHFDASGFPSLRPDEPTPSTLEGARIHVYARIILVANLYDRLANPIRGPRRPNYEILSLLKSTYAAWLDPVIVKTLEQIVPPFPPGSRVRLSDGTTAIIIELNDERPQCPKVRRLAGKGLELAPDLIDLQEPGAPFILTGSPEQRPPELVVTTTA